VADRRYLGGIVVRDAATGAPVTESVRLASPSATFFRNRRGTFIIASASGLEEHEDEFEEPPELPDPESLSIEVLLDDPSGTYLPRRFNVALPRAVPHQAITVEAYRSPSAPVSPNWTIVRGRLVDAAGAPLVAAVVRVRRRDGDQALLGVSHSVPVLHALGLGARETRGGRVHGEVAVPLIGVPVSIWGEDTEASVLVESIPVTLEVVPATDATPPIDPDQFLSLPVLSENRWSLDVASGRLVNAGTLSVTVP
jgi:hypothetical protein